MQLAYLSDAFCIVLSDFIFQQIRAFHSLFKCSSFSCCSGSHWISRIISPNWAQSFDEENYLLSKTNPEISCTVFTIPSCRCFLFCHTNPTPVLDRSSMEISFMMICMFDLTKIWQHMSLLTHPFLDFAAALEVHWPGQRQIFVGASCCPWVILLSLKMNLNYVIKVKFEYTLF